MSAGIANWLQVNIVNNPQVLESLIALVMLIVASFLMSEKSAKKIPFKRISGAVLFVFAMFVFLYANIADLADVFTIWAMLVLAGVAVFSFEESRRLREENRQREKRDRKERLLNEIIEWAERILLYGVGETVREGWAQLSDEQKTEKSFAMRKGLGFMDIRDKGISIIYMSSYIDTDLKIYVDTTMKLLKEHIDKWTQVKSGEIKDWPTIAAHKSELDKSARQLIKKATTLLCKLII